MSVIRFIYANERGVGKTSLNTVFALNEMRDRQAYEQSLAEIDLLEQELDRTFKRPPTIQPHFVYSDYEIRDNHKYSRGYVSWPFNPFKFKLPNKQSQYSIFAPGSFFHISEAQTKYNSRKFKKFMVAVSASYEGSRHAGFTITLDGLGLTSIDSKIRKIVDEFICVLGTEHSMYDGRIVGTTWHCRVFDNIVDAESYDSTHNDKLGTLVDYSFTYGKIFNCYKSRNNKLAFYRDASDHDFEYLSWDEIDSDFMLPPDDYYEKEE